MKKQDSNNNLRWLILFLIFLTIGGIEIIMWKNYFYKDRTMPDNIEVPTASATDSHVINYTGDMDIQSMYDMLTGDEVDIPDTHDYIFVGDSRYVAMSECKGDMDTFVCENGVGRSFLDANLNKVISLATDNTRIIVGLGVNDIYAGTKDYTDMLVKLSEDTDAEIYYMLVNPVDDASCEYSGYGITNAAIDSFNTEITAALAGTDIKVIDTNSFLKNDGYISYDGLHYDEATTLKIYQYIKVCINN